MALLLAYGVVATIVIVVLMLRSRCAKVSIDETRVCWVSHNEGARKYGALEVPFHV